jgi:hypothetical protein
LQLLGLAALPSSHIITIITNVTLKAQKKPNHEETGPASAVVWSIPQEETCRK